MKRRWFQHLKDKEEKEKFRQRLIANRDLFVMLQEILEEKRSAAAKERRGLKSYVIQNWSEWQADRNATERTLEEIIGLLPLEE